MPHVREGLEGGQRGPNRAGKGENSESQSGRQRRPRKVLQSSTDLASKDRSGVDLGGSSEGGGTSWTLGVA